MKTGGRTEVWASADTLSLQEGKPVQGNDRQPIKGEGERGDDRQAIKGKGNKGVLGWR